MQDTEDRVEYAKTTTRIDRDGNRVDTVSVDPFPKEIHERIKEIAATNGDSVGNTYSDAIISMKRDYDRGNIHPLLNPIKGSGRIQVWLRYEADLAMRQLAEELRGELTAVVYTAIVLAYGKDQLEK